MKHALPIFLLSCVVVLVGGLTLRAVRNYAGHERLIPPLTRPPAHGNEFILEISPAGLPVRTLAQLHDALVQRLSRCGLPCFIEFTSPSRLRVDLPFATRRVSLDVCRDVITQPGALDFRMVYDRSRQPVQFGLFIPLGYESMQHIVSGNGGDKLEVLAVKTEPEPGLSGNIIARAVVFRDYLGRLQMGIKLKPEAMAALARLTRQNIDQRLAIVIDGKLYTAFDIITPILNGTVVITGNYTSAQVITLAAILPSPLPVPVKLVSETQF